VLVDDAAVVVLVEMPEATMLTVENEVDKELEPDSRQDQKVV
jgi:hypothetical protein